MTTNPTAMLILPRVKPCHTHSFDYCGDFLVVSSDGPDGYSVNLQTRHQPESFAHAGHWYGTETRCDTEGGTWSRYIGHHVIDDFGNLVPVPA